jgi:hypothetical protein
MYTGRLSLMLESGIMLKVICSFFTVDFAHPYRLPIIRSKEKAITAPVAYHEKKVVSFNFNMRRYPEFMFIINKAQKFQKADQLAGQHEDGPRIALNAKYNIHGSAFDICRRGIDYPCQRSERFGFFAVAGTG